MSRLGLLRRMILNSITLLCITLAIAYLGGMAFAYLVADKMIFPYSGSSYPDSDELIKLSSSDGERITAYHLANNSSPQLLLYSHGNGEDLGNIRPTLETFQARGLSVFAYDYPGYGQSTGTPSEGGVYAAAEAAYVYATETLGYAPENITLYGRSLGSGPSCWLAELYPVRGLILDGAFSSTFRVLTKIRILPWDRFNNLARLPSIKCPVLLLHGVNDQTVPFTHALQNQKAIQAPVQSLWSDTAGHNDLIEQLGPTYWNTVLSFSGITL